MRLPNALTLSEVQSALRDIHSVIQPIQNRLVDMNGGRITNAGKAIESFDYVRKFEADQEVARLQGELTALRREFDAFKARFYGTVEIPFPSGSR